MTLLAQATAETGAIVGQWGAFGAILLTAFAALAWMTRKAFDSAAARTTDKDTCAAALAADRKEFGDQVVRLTSAVEQLTRVVEEGQHASFRNTTAIEKMAADLNSIIRDALARGERRTASSQTTPAVPR